MKNESTRIWMYPSLMIGLLVMLTISCEKEDNNNTVTDIDGNVYHTVTIGTQVWMVENLNTTRYRNGDAISFIPDISYSNITQWENIQTGAYCNYGNNENNATIYGKLYNWYAVSDSRNIAPIGWHIPTDAEWTTLIDYLGGKSVAGGKLKEIGTYHWVSPNEGATNETGFTALPGGIISYPSLFQNIGYNGLWWSTTEWLNENLAYGRTLFNDTSLVYRSSPDKNSGLSVRCLRD